MNKTIAFLGISLLFIVSVPGQEMVFPPGEPEKKPEIKFIDPPVPVRPPNDFRQVALLNIALRYVDGKVVASEVQSSKRINSIAPKVFARQGGDWLVTLHGGEEHSFFVFNPGYLEAENREGASTPYTYVAQDGTVNWKLVVPLYRDGKRIEADSFSIKDRRTDEVILTSDL